VAPLAGGMPRGVGRDLGNDESVTLVGEAVEEIPVPIQRPDAERPGEDTAEEERHRERRTNLRGGESEPEHDGGECEVEPVVCIDSVLGLGEGSRT
jgi:hypothetical protein